MKTEREIAIIAAQLVEILNSEMEKGKKVETDIDLAKTFTLIEAFCWALDIPCFFQEVADNLLKRGASITDEQVQGWIAGQREVSINAMREQSNSREQDHGTIQTNIPE